MTNVEYRQDCENMLDFMEDTATAGFKFLNFITSL
jgi:hypothetical protein